MLYWHIFSPEFIYILFPPSWHQHHIFTSVLEFINFKLKSTSTTLILYQGPDSLSGTKLQKKGPVTGKYKGSDDIQNLEINLMECNNCMDCVKHCLNKQSLQINLYYHPNISVVY